MVFDLIGAGGDFGGGKGGFKVLLCVVGYAYAAGFAGSLNGLHCCPGVLEVLVRFCEERGVNQVANFKFLATYVKRFQPIIRSRGQEFGLTDQHSQAAVSLS